MEYDWCEGPIIPQVSTNCKIIFSILTLLTYNLFSCNCQYIILLSVCLHAVLHNFQEPIDILYDSGPMDKDVDDSEYLDTGDNTYNKPINSLAPCNFQC